MYTKHVASGDTTGTILYIANKTAIDTVAITGYFARCKFSRMAPRLMKIYAGLFLKFSCGF